MATQSDSPRCAPSAPHVDDVPQPPFYERVLILATTGVLIALAAFYLKGMEPVRTAAATYDAAMAAMGMAPTPWSFRELTVAAAMWTVMMVGMMAGAAAPVILVYAATRRHRGQRVTPTSLVMFGTGYFLVWVAFSLWAALIEALLHNYALLTAEQALRGAVFGGSLLILAGLYQVSSWKDACLQHCRRPLGFLLAHWQDGRRGALLMGLRHGLFCVGCCWALMLLLFVAGTMNLIWVALLAVFVLLERLHPIPIALSRAAGFALVTAGLAAIYLG